MSRDASGVDRPGHAGARAAQAPSACGSNGLHPDLREHSGHETGGAADPASIVWELAGEVRDHAGIQKELAALDARLAYASATKSRPVARRRVRMAAGIAAVVAALVATGLRQPAESPLTGEYATSVGEQRDVSLPDGTVVKLNSGSRLRSRYTAVLRSVELVQGEAVFAVVKDPQRRFVVTSNGGETRAVGTKFAVEAYSSVTRVTVLEGRVIVCGSESATSRRAERAVIPGEAVDYDRSGAVGQPYRGNTERVLAWEDHLIRFDDVPLEEAVREYNRYAREPIKLAAPRAARLPIYGTFHIGDESAFLSALHSALKVGVERRGATVTIHDAPDRDRHQALP